MTPIITNATEAIMTNKTWSLLGSIALSIGSAHAGTVLIDYNDGVTGGGHDAAVLNGGFESGTDLSGTANFVDVDNWLNMRGLESVQATTDTLSATGARSAIMSGNTSLYALNTGYTIGAGDFFTGSFDWRTALNSTVNDVMKVTLFYTADDTLPATATEFDAGLVNLYSFTASPATALNTYETASWTSPAIALGDGAIGKTLMFRFESLGQSTPVPIHFGRMDNLYLEAMSVPEPSSLGLVAFLGSGILLRRRRLVS